MERVPNVLLSRPTLRWVLSAIELEASDLNRDQEIKIDSFLVAAVIESVSSLAHSREARGGVVGMFERYDLCYPPRCCRCIAAQNILFQTCFKEGDATAHGRCAALGLCALPLDETLVSFLCSALNVPGPRLHSNTSENSVDEIAKITPAFLADRNSDLDGSCQFRYRLIKIKRLFWAQSSC